MILTVTLNTSIDKLYMLQKQTPYSVMRVQEVINTAGGKGMNVSRVAAKLGEPVTAMGFIGGFTGQYFESLITQPEIRKAFTRIAAETRSCINIWDASCGMSTEYLEPGALVEESELARFFMDFQRQLPNADVVTISGSMPKGVPADAYEVMIRLCCDAGKPVLLDTSGVSLKSTLRARPTLIKPNTDELTQLIGSVPSSFEGLAEAAYELHRGDIPMVVLSLGAQGAVMACAQGTYWGKPPWITPKNTVGCGDSMLAGLAVGIARKRSIMEQLRLAIAVSAASALSLATGDFNPDDYHAIYPNVEIAQLN